ncbi:MAG TPA: hypothetical protein VNN22_12190 [Verrucomicrobiae bacterium]|nr:hypothetical protein [Verrucomicrobiae bacterium]
MHHKFITVSFLAATLAMTGCQSGVTNIGVSRNSETGPAIANLDDAQRQYQKNVEVYKQAMMDYEKAHGDSCGYIMFSSIVGPLQTPEPRAHICKLQGMSRRCGYQNYQVRITYADDACRIVKTVEVLERMT